MSPTVLGTLAGQVMGTAGYMAPEQVLGDVEIDQRADLFAFGCVLYEMASGRRAFGAETALDTLHAIARTEPQPPGGNQARRARGAAYLATLPTERLDRPRSIRAEGCEPSAAEAKIPAEGMFLHAGTLGSL